MHAHHCRGCRAPLTETFVDLGTSPVSNAYLRPDELTRGEMYYPLHAKVCSQCFLVQLPVFESPADIFSADYAYFSSFSESWLRQCREYAERSIGELGLNADSLVAEVASNDGYLLQYFAQAAVPVLGIEPAGSVAAAARAKGVRTETVFFGESTATELRERYGAADLMAANNVIAHVPDLHDFVAGFTAMLAPMGRASIEFPHLLNLIEQTQFDTIYHEHFSYLSLLALDPVFEAHGLQVIDVEKLPTHGGSLRAWIAHTGAFSSSKRVGEVLREEERGGLRNLQTYRSFSPKVHAVKRKFLHFLVQAQEQAKTVVGYGAAAKGNTFLNYAGVRGDSMTYVVDRNPHKQGRYLPGSRIPIYDPAKISQTRPDYVVILPWNISDEVMEQMAEIRSWGGRFVTAVPDLIIH